MDVEMIADTTFIETFSYRIKILSKASRTILPTSLKTLEEVAGCERSDCQTQLLDSGIIFPF